MSDYSDLVRKLRSPSWSGYSATTAAADAIDALTARVAQLEACLTDVCHQMELGGIER